MKGRGIDENDTQGYSDIHGGMPAHHAISVVSVEDSIEKRAGGLPVYLGPMLGSGHLISYESWPARPDTIRECYFQAAG
ncbi:hypothetical protein [Paenibacillus planticolens]|uniref:Uncharacterized protein n=1 Tax=Paenibacillus planticolens TaxID=2654976 RepID=A0ABX1ZHT5_9BACL|nr:hypothetical protein [Paenibacillus planticolens]NOU99638.1 hypothetical protein [Paenibacillus planticolens]